MLKLYEKSLSTQNAMQLQAQLTVSIVVLCCIATCLDLIIVGDILNNLAILLESGRPMKNCPLMSR